MNNILKSLSRAARMMLSPRIWALAWRPALLAIILWSIVGGLLWWGFGDEVFSWLSAMKDRWAMNDSWWASILNWMLQAGFWLAIGLSGLLLMVLSAMLLISIFGMNHINRAVADRYFPDLHIKGQVTTWQSLKNTTAWTFWFAFFWIVSTPAYLFAGAGAILHIGVMARYNQKVFTFDALAEYADASEYQAISTLHNAPLFGLGIFITLMGALPTFVWMGSVIGVVLLPLTAILSVVTFTALFTFCGLTYSCYCLQALNDHRAAQRNALLTKVLSD